MTDLEKAQKIYAILFSEGTENNGNVPAFEDLAALVSRGSQCSFWFKTGKKKLKIDAQLSFMRHDTNNTEDTTMGEKFAIAPFLFILALAGAGFYVLTKVFKKHTGAPPTKAENRPETRAASPVQPKQAVSGLNHLLLALDLDTAERLFPGCSKGASIPIQDGRKLFDSSPYLLADQKKERVERIKQDASDAKPAKGHAILSIELSAAAMSNFQKGHGSNNQREAFEKLNGKSLLVLGFMEELPHDLAFYDIG